MAEQVIGEKPRPRVLIMGLDSRPDLVAAVRQLAPTVEEVESLHAVRQQEWDCLVTDERWAGHSSWGYRSWAAEHLSVFYVEDPARDTGTIELGAIEFKGDVVGVAVTPQRGKVINEFRQIPSDLADALKRLVHESLLPVALQRASQHYFQSRPPQGQRDTNIVAAAWRFLHPFLLTVELDVLAGWYQRSVESEAWLLPADAVRLPQWLRAAFRTWHDKYPARFPRLLDWSGEPAWQSVDELALSERLANLQRERDESAATYDAQIRAVEASLADAANEADRRHRRLLNAESSELVEAVVDALDVLGHVHGRGDGCESAGTASTQSASPTKPRSSGASRPRAAGSTSPCEQSRLRPPCSSGLVTTACCSSTLHCSSTSQTGFAHRVMAGLRLRPRTHQSARLQVRVRVRREGPASVGRSRGSTDDGRLGLQPSLQLSD